MKYSVRILPEAYNELEASAVWWAKHRSSEEDLRWYDGFIAKSKVSFDYPRSFAAGDECAFIGTVYNQLPDGREMACEGVFVYKVNAEGKLLSLRAFWEFERPRWEGQEHPPVGRERA